MAGSARRLIIAAGVLLAALLPARAENPFWQNLLYVAPIDTTVAAAARATRERTSLAQDAIRKTFQLDDGLNASSELFATIGKALDDYRGTRAQAANPEARLGWDRAETEAFARWPEIFRALGASDLARRTLRREIETRLERLRGSVAADPELSALTQELVAQAMLSAALRSRAVTEVFLPVAVVLAAEDSGVVNARAAATIVYLSGPANVESREGLEAAAELRALLGRLERVEVASLRDAERLVRIRLDAIDTALLLSGPSSAREALTGDRDETRKMLDGVRALLVVRERTLEASGPRLAEEPASPPGIHGYASDEALKRWREAQASMLALVSDRNVGAEALHQAVNAVANGSFNVESVIKAGQSGNPDATAAMMKLVRASASAGTRAGELAAAAQQVASEGSSPPPESAGEAIERARNFLGEIGAGRGGGVGAVITSTVGKELIEQSNNILTLSSNNASAEEKAKAFVGLAENLIPAGRIGKAIDAASGALPGPLQQLVKQATTNALTEGARGAAVAAATEVFAKIELENREKVEIPRLEEKIAEVRIEQLTERIDDARMKANIALIVGELKSDGVSDEIIQAASVFIGQHLGLDGARPTPAEISWVGVTIQKPPAVDMEQARAEINGALGRLEATGDFDHFEQDMRDVRVKVEEACRYKRTIAMENRPHFEGTAEYQEHVTRTRAFNEKYGLDLNPAEPGGWWYGFNEKITALWQAHGEAVATAARTEEKEILDAYTEKRGRFENASWWLLGDDQLNAEIGGVTLQRVNALVEAAYNLASPMREAIYRSRQQAVTRAYAFIGKAEEFRKAAQYSGDARPCVDQVLPTAMAVSEVGDPAAELAARLSEKLDQLVEMAEQYGDFGPLIRAYAMSLSGITGLKLKKSPSVAMGELNKRKYEGAKARADIEGMIRAVAFQQTGLPDPKSGIANASADLDAMNGDRYREAFARGDVDAMDKAMAFAQTGLCDGKTVPTLEEHLKNIARLRRSSGGVPDGTRGEEEGALEPGFENSQEIQMMDFEVDRLVRLYREECSRSSSDAKRAADDAVAEADDIVERLGQCQREQQAVGSVVAPFVALAEGAVRACLPPEHNEVTEENMLQYGLPFGMPYRIADLKKYVAGQVRGAERAEGRMAGLSAWRDGVRSAREEIARGADAASDAATHPNAARLLNPGAGGVSPNGAPGAPGGIGGGGVFSSMASALAGSRAEQSGAAARSFVEDTFAELQRIVKEWDENGARFGTFLDALRRANVMSSSEDMSMRNISELERELEWRRQNRTYMDGDQQARGREARRLLALPGDEDALAKRRRMEEILKEADRRTASPRTWPAGAPSIDQVSELARRAWMLAQTGRAHPEALSRLADAIVGIEASPSPPTQEEARIVPPPAPSRPPEAGAASEAGPQIADVKAILERLFTAYEAENASAFEEVLANGFTGSDRSGHNYDAARFSSAMRDDFRNLDRIEFQVNVTRMQYYPGENRVKAELSWRRRAYLQTSAQEWLLDGQQSTLIFQRDAVTQAMKLSGIEGDPIFGIAEPLGPLVISGGTLGGAKVTTPIVVNGGETTSANPTTAPPTASIAASPAVGSPPLAVTFTANASDPDGFIASYAWNFGDNTTGSGQSVTHTYALVGTYLASLTATDNSGASATASTMITVRNLPPTVSVTAMPSSGNAPLLVTFTATASDPDGTIASYAWDFGDGQSSTLANPTHTYAVGNYTATVTVTDNLGATATASSGISVASSDMHFSGSVCADSTWSGNVFVDGDVTVCPGTTLTIASGAVVTFTGNFNLTVNGMLAANAATFRGQTATAGFWKAIVFNSGSTCNMTGNVITDGGSGTNPGNGLYLGAATFRSGCNVAAFAGNTLSNHQNAVVDLGSSAMLSNNTVQNSQIGYFMFSGSPTITGGSISNCSDKGIYRNSVPGFGHLALTVTGVSFNMNHTHILCEIQSDAAFTVTGNTFGSTTGGGGSAVFEIFGNGPHTFSNNTVSGSFANFDRIFYFSSGSTISNNNVTVTSMAGGLGRDIIQVFGSLTVTGNTFIAAANASVVDVIYFNSTGGAVMVTNNTIDGGNNLFVEGIKSVNTAATITGNTIRNCNNGLNHTTGNYTVSGNTFTGCNQGIIINSGNLTIQSNNFIDNIGTGFNGDFTSPMDNNFFSGNNGAGSGVVDTSTCAPTSCSTTPQYFGAGTITNPRSTPN